MSDSNLDEEQLLDLLLAEAGITMSAADTIPLRTQGINNQENNPILSFAQQRMWFFDQIEPDNPFYNNSITLSFNGLLDVPNLELSLKALVERHETLRTNFKAIAGQPVQVIAPTQVTNLSVVDLQGLATNLQSIEVKQLIKAEAQIPFKLSTDALWRTKLLKLSAESHILIITIHHIISDGWSMGVLVNDLTSFYEALRNQTAPALPTLTVQYADFAEWQHQWLQGDRLASQLDYWKQQLDGALPILDLPSDHPRPPVQTYRGAVTSFQCDRNLTQQLGALSQRSGATLFMTLFTAFAVLLYRYSGQQDLVIGSPIANRNHVEIENLIGFFANTLSLRVRVDNNLTFEQLLTQVQETTLGAYSHQDLPFDLLVEQLKTERHLSHNPIVQVMFALQNSPLPSIKLPNLEISQIISFDSGAVRLDLEMHLWESPDGLRGDVVYSTDLFDAETIEQLIANFQTLLGGIVSNPQQRVAELPILAEIARQKILLACQETQADYPRNKTIHQLFEEQVGKTPDAIAIIFEDQQMTYQELNERANQLGHYLQQLGVCRETIVGVSVERSLEMVMGILGIWKAGGAYLPLDPSYPSERIAYMIENAGISLLLTQQKLVDKFSQFQGRLLCLDIPLDLLGSEHRGNVKSDVCPDHLAYMIYTSGSTGKPKGVLGLHRGLVNLSQFQIQTFDLDSASRILQFASFSFDASLWEIIMALISGARLYLSQAQAILPGPPLAQFCQREAITHLTLPPSTLTVMTPADLPNVKVLIVAGEACPVHLAAEWSRDRNFFNAYGPTETTVCATIYHYANKESNSYQRIPIGRAINNVSVYILDPYLQPVPIGVVGEIYIGGISLARGYHRQLELTAQKFIANPFSNDPCDRLYRTGDTGKYLSDGNIEYFGRTDHQFKLRGFRIETGEVEAVIYQHKDIQEAIIVAKDDRLGNKSLIAYVVANPETKISPSELRSFLREKLPDYMIPAAFVVMDKLPLTPNGKVDRSALPSPTSDRSADILGGDLDAAAPTNADEIIIANIWLQILGLEKVGIHDNFFDIGGNSLLVIQVHNQLQQILKRDISVVDLFRYTTINALAEYLAIDGDIRDRKLSDQSSDRKIDRIDKQKQALKRQQQLSNQRRKGNG